MKWRLILTFFSFGRRNDPEMKKSVKSKVEHPRKLPPINFKGNKKEFNLNESLRGYRSLKDDSARRETRNGDDGRAEPINNRKASYQRLTKEDDEEIMDDVFGNSLERNSKKSSKRRRRRVNNSEDVQA